MQKDIIYTYMVLALSVLDFAARAARDGNGMEHDEDMDGFCS